MFHHDVENLEDVSSSLYSLQNEVDDLGRQTESHHVDLTDRIESAESENSQADRRLDKVESQLQQLADQIAVLERRALMATSIERADFNTRTPTERRFARNARRGKELEAGLLPEVIRKTKSNSIAAVDEAARNLASIEDALVATTGLLADPGQRDPRTTAHQNMRAQFGKCKDTVLAQRRFMPSHRPEAAEKDRATLAADAKKRAKHGVEIDTGQQDWFRLCKALRNRVSKAVDSGAALPPWFTTVLGPTPPATRTEKWVNTATLLLAYRAMYDITDLVVALGSRPSDTGLRHSLHEQLEGELIHYRRR